MGGAEDVLRFVHTFICSCECKAVQGGGLIRWCRWVGCGAGLVGDAAVRGWSVSLRVWWRPLTALPGVGD